MQSSTAESPEALTEVCDSHRTETAVRPVADQDEADPEAQQKPEATLPAIPAEFECTICLLLFCEPVTSPCGHTFCQRCLSNALAHSPKCPMCRQPVYEGLSPNVALKTFLRRQYPEQYEARVAEETQEEQREASRLVQSVPLRADGQQHFVSGEPRRLAVMFLDIPPVWPSQKITLHLFEPRYVLMVQRCLARGEQHRTFVLQRHPRPGRDHRYGCLVKIVRYEVTAAGFWVECLALERVLLLEVPAEEQGSAGLHQASCVPFHDAEVHAQSREPGNASETPALSDDVTSMAWAAYEAVNSALATLTWHTRAALQRSTGVPLPLPPPWQPPGPADPLQLFAFSCRLCALLRFGGAAGGADRRWELFAVDSLEERLRFVCDTVLTSQAVTGDTPRRRELGARRLFDTAGVAKVGLFYSLQSSVVLMLVIFIGLVLHQHKQQLAEHSHTAWESFKAAWKSPERAQ